MKMRILSVAYPLAQVQMDATGGAEQILAQLDRALVEAGHSSTVIACQGSQCARSLISPAQSRRNKHRKEGRVPDEGYQYTVARALRDGEFDLVHMHGLDFHKYLPDSGPPVLVTLHLPVDFYPFGALFPSRRDVWFNAVSGTQKATLPEGMRLLGAIENGVQVMKQPAARKEDFALMLTRICPEKGVHLAIDAAKRAGMRLIICGEVFSYPEHQSYFSKEVVPRLDHQRRFAGPVRGRAKRSLLAGARCLLVASLVAETGSLVAREAMAAGTPVVAYRTGALTEIIEPGKTGFLVGDVGEMAQAMRRAAELSPAACLHHARRNFPLERMIDGYFAAYRAVISATAGLKVA